MAGRFSISVHRPLDPAAPTALPAAALPAARTPSNPMIVIPASGEPIE
jgi:hypothetical protein